VTSPTTVPAAWTSWPDKICTHFAPHAGVWRDACTPSSPIGRVAVQTSRSSGVDPGGLHEWRWSGLTTES
jgi:hypothetical protein